jgi:hypothetical protein
VLKGELEISRVFGIFAGFPRKACCLGISKNFGNGIFGFYILFLDFAGFSGFLRDFGFLAEFRVLGIFAGFFALSENGSGPRKWQQGCCIYRPRMANGFGVNHGWHMVSAPWFWCKPWVAHGFGPMVLV